MQRNIILEDNSVFYNNTIIRHDECIDSYLELKYQKHNKDVWEKRFVLNNISIDWHSYDSDKQNLLIVSDNMIYASHENELIKIDFRGDFINKLAIVDSVIINVFDSEDKDGFFIYYNPRFLKYNNFNSSIFKISYDLELLWNYKINGDNLTIVDFKYIDNKLFAWTWDSYRHEINPKSGKMIEILWTK